jgi:hypothetical protein
MATAEPFPMVPEAIEEESIRQGIRCGLSSQQIHEETGISLERIRRYREHLNERGTIVPVVNGFMQAAAVARIRNRRGGNNV